MPEKNQLWMGFARTAVSGIIAAIAVIFFFGGREAKINDLVTWKTKAEPTMQRMDTTGTLSFDLFHKQYEKDLHRIDEQLKELEKEIKELRKHDG